MVDPNISLVTNVPVYSRNEDPAEGLIIAGTGREVTHLVSLFNLGFGIDQLFHD